MLASYYLFLKAHMFDKMPEIKVVISPPKKSDKSGEFRLQAKNLASILKLWVTVLLMIFSFLFYFNLRENNKSKSVSRQEHSNPHEKLCPVKAVTIDDGLCDDLANNAPCLYDGGDCCLEHKPKVLCNDCLCKLGEFNISALYVERESLWIKVCLETDDLNIVKSIDNVQNDLTCMVRCSNDSIESNAWSVLKTNHDLDCFCYNFPPGLCPTNFNHDMNFNLPTVYYNPQKMVCSTINDHGLQDQSTSEVLEEDSNLGIANMSKILIATGSIHKGSPPEMVDFNRQQGIVCDVSLKVQEHLKASVGGLLYDHNNEPFPLVCGGLVHNEAFQTFLNYDYCVNIITGSQIHFEEGRLKIFAASTVVNNQLWITGGTSNPNSDDSYEDSILVGSDSLMAGPDLPVPNHGHCLANHYQEERVYLLGGKGAPVNVWSIRYFGVENSFGFWQPEPFLSKGRAASACGIISDTMDSTTFYVVIAGSEKYDLVEEGQGTEFMKIGDNYFQTGPRLPFQMMNAASVTDGDTLLILGGSSDDIGYTHLSAMVVFKCQNKICKWTQLDQELNSRRKSFVTMLIPDNLLECISDLSNMYIMTNFAIL